MIVIAYCKLISIACGPFSSAAITEYQDVYFWGSHSRIKTSAGVRFSLPEQHPNITTSSPKDVERLKDVECSLKNFPIWGATGEPLRFKIVLKPLAGQSK
jgi:hypothetical protein